RQEWRSGDDQKGEWGDKTNSGCAMHLRHEEPRNEGRGRRWSAFVLTQTRQTLSALCPTRFILPPRPPRRQFVPFSLICGQTPLLPSGSDPDVAVGVIPHWGLGADGALRQAEHGQGGPFGERREHAEVGR